MAAGAARAAEKLGPDDCCDEVTTTAREQRAAASGAAREVIAREGVARGVSVAGASRGV